MNLKDFEDYYNASAVATGRSISPSIVPVYKQVIRTVFEKRYSPYQSSFYNLNKRQQTPNKAFDCVNRFAISVRMTKVGLALNLHLKSSYLIAHTFQKKTMALSVTSKSTLRKSTALTFCQSI